MCIRRNVCLVLMFFWLLFFGPGFSFSPGFNWGTNQAYAQSEDFNDEDFNLVQSEREASEEAKPIVSDADENIDYDGLLQKVKLEELPRGYRHYYLGAEGYRPNTISLSVGGRTPGVGLSFDYSWNRVGIGASMSQRSVTRLQTESGGETTEGADSQQFYNAYVFYNLIPYPVSPYIIVGLEYAIQTKDVFQVMSGLGVEARIYYGLTLFVEYVRHETDKESFPGAALGWAF